MKKNFNIIQIKGFRGILYIAFVGCCLAAGFGWFPGWLCMKIWNFATQYFTQIPSIGIVQGLLLWAIIAAAYFTFRKEKLVVCMKTSDCLSEEELKSVFEELKQQTKSEMFLKNMIKAKEAELKIKNLSESNIPAVKITDIKDISSHNKKNEQTEKVQTK